MKKLAFLFVAFVSVSCFAQEASTDAITANGQRLIKLLDATRVEELWQKGYRINWETGESTALSNKSTSTHCSAFAAAFAKRVGIYLLRPPEHEMHLLANAQYDWLQTFAAAKEGWERVLSALEAQNLANRGQLVIGVYKNDNDTKPGHIAVIRPAVKTLSLLATEGPQVTQAGGINYYSASLKEGFKRHPKAWPNGVAYYTHAISY